jgi:AraC-like DNA-binding protein
MSMDLMCEEKPSDSPFVERIWRRQGERSASSFISMAETHWVMVVTKYWGRTVLTVHGPETRATPAYAPADAEYFAIMFKPGTFMPILPARIAVDRRDVDLPEATSKSFWLNGSAWEFPNFENADTFVDRLVRKDLLVRDPVVEAILRGQPVKMSSRTMQRHFLEATGLTYATVRQIERARYAATLLKQGISIPDAVHEAGYFDQPHLTRSLKHYVGLTPAQILDKGRSERLSLLYKTAPF